MSKKILITEAVDPAGITLLQDQGFSGSTCVSG